MACWASGAAARRAPGALEPGDILLHAVLPAAAREIQRGDAAAEAAALAEGAPLLAGDVVQEAVPGAGAIYLLACVAK